MPSDDMIREEALGWAVRVGDPAFADWAAFTDWLERDPRNAAAYDAAMAAVVDAQQIWDEVAPANDDQDVGPPHRSTAGWRRWAGIVAMALVVVLAFGAWRHLTPDYYTVETGVGDVRVVELSPGNRVEVAGGSSIRFDRKNPRFADLKHGRALFTVAHDDSDPFRVTAGRDTIVDVGTVFDVRVDAQALSVAVSEGAVQVNPDAENAHVAAGQMLVRDGGQIRLGPIEPVQVGEWREGRLTFDDETLASVAAELSRGTGVAFSVDPASAWRRISGSILIEPVRDDPASVGPLLGIAVAKRADGWMLGLR